MLALALRTMSAGKWLGRWLRASLRHQRRLLFPTPDEIVGNLDSATQREKDKAAKLKAVLEAKRRLVSARAYTTTIRSEIALVDHPKQSTRQEVEQVAEQETDKASPSMGSSRPRPRSSSGR